MTEKQIEEKVNSFLDENIALGLTDQEVLEKLDHMLEAGYPDAGIIANYLYRDLSEEEQKEHEELKQASKDKG